jgi:hypothetical protein
VQLDHTEIVIRQRSALELLDLSLLVLRRHFSSIWKTSALLGFPLLLIDVWAVSWMLNEDSYLAAENLAEPLTFMRWRHSCHLCLLFVCQFQLISLPTTVFLGNQIFFEPMSIDRLLKRLWPIAFRCIFVLGLLRLGLVGLAGEFWIDRSVPFDWTAEFWLVLGVSSMALAIRAGWPFAPEILGLELCPLRASRGDEITYAQRSRGMHKLLVSEHVGRFMGAAFFGVLLTCMLLGVLLFIKGVATGSWAWDAWFDHLLFPLTMWLVGLFLAVYRFLAYLDSRIRLEGWEIELRLRAEAERLAQKSRKPKVSTELVSEQVTT